MMFLIMQAQHMRRLFAQLLTLPYLFILGILLTLLPLGCGGGTSGTGDIEPTRLEGRLLNASNTPVEGALITVIESGEQGITDAQGDFAIETELLVDAVINLSVLTESANASVSIGVRGAGQQLITVVLRLDETNNKVTVDSSNVPPTPTPGAEPKATSTKSSDSPSSPSATPTISDLGGGATPAPPTPSSAPETTPTAAPTSTATQSPASTPTSQGSVIQGEVRSTDISIKNLPITILQTGDSGVTDAAGRFSINIPSIGGDLTLRVGPRDFSPTATISGIPAQDVNIYLVIVFSVDSSLPLEDPSRNSISIFDISVAP